mgnify:CR=1 FL=1
MWSSLRFDVEAEVVTEPADDPALAPKPVLRALDGAANELDNLATGDTARVDQARGRILDALPNRSDRAFSLDEYVDAVFTVEYPCDDACGVYRRRTLDEAMRVVGAHA